MKNIISNIKFFLKLWNINARYCDLDIDMMCTNMKFEDYLKDELLLDQEKEELFQKYKKENQ